MSNENTVIAEYSPTKKSVCRSLYQYDYGQKLVLVGFDMLPAYYEVQFSNNPNGESKTVLGDETGVMIPDEYLLSGKPVYAWIYIHNGENNGSTYYMIIIPVYKRAKPNNPKPTPEQQDEIEQIIAVMNEAMTTTVAAAEPPTRLKEAYK